MLINVGTKAADKGSEFILKIGNKVQEKLDSTGVTDKVNNIVDTTSYYTEVIYEKSTEKIAKA